MKLLNVEAERVKHQLSKEELASMLGVTVKTYRNWVAGKTEMPLSRLLVLTNEWGKTLDYLLGLTDQ